MPPFPRPGHAPNCHPARRRRRPDRGGRGGGAPGVGGEGTGGEQPRRRRAARAGRDRERRQDADRRERRRRRDGARRRGARARSPRHQQDHECAPTSSASRRSASAARRCRPSRRCRASRSQTADQDGAGIEVDGDRRPGGARGADAPASAAPPCTVRSLFFNTPARRKFLRSAASETRACHEAVVTLALAHPEVGFEFHADQVCRFQVPAGQSLAERLRATVGPRAVRHAAAGDASRRARSGCSGFVQRPADARPTGRRTQLFVNGRPFRDTFLVRAAEAGYRSAIAPGRPALALPATRRCSPARWT